MKPLKIGDYVLATKYSDGDPKDHFCVGFFNGMTGHTVKRYEVVDDKGINFRGNGFRRCERISGNTGAILVSCISLIEQSWHSVWYWKKHPKQLIELSEKLSDKTTEEVTK